MAGELNAYDILVNDWLLFTDETLPGEIRRSRRAGRRHRGRKRVMRDPHNVLIRPVVSEKSHPDDNVMFAADPSATKIDVRPPSSRPSTCGWTRSTPSTGRA